MIHTKDDFVFFWHEYEDNGCFSLWFHASFTVEGITYQTCEQYMMAKKALLFGDMENYRLIMGEADPRRVKVYGKAVQNYDSAAWHGCNEEIIYNGNLAKFSQNASLRAALLATGDKILAEASPKDRIYGIGFEADDQEALNPDLWQGTNLLGEALMKVRKTLLEEDEKNVIEVCGGIKYKKMPPLRGNRV